MSMKTAYGTTEIARICHVTPQTVKRWIERGHLPHFTTAGGHRRVWDGDLAGFLRAHNIPVPAGLSGAGGGVRVLIVEDDAQQRRLMSRLVSAHAPDAEVHEAADGFEAGRKVLAVAPALIILDMRLPGVDGLKVCASIRAEPSLARVRILAVSGFDAERSRAGCLKAGADDFLAKPFEPADFTRRLAALLEP